MKIALGVEYDGHDYHGWQAQKNLATVQGCLEQALSIVADQPILTFCAGRTDAGVHAVGQVVHFVTDAHRPLRAWVFGVNSHLPSSIAVRWAHEVDDDFHARFSATARRYRYVIYNYPSRPALLRSRVTWCFDTLNAERMHHAGQYLLGELDFSSFRSSECESLSPMREVKSLTVQRANDVITIDIEANAFLHHMVRNIVGVLLRVGSGLKKPEWVHEVLMAKDRRQAAETAHASGLYLMKVTYPPHFLLPERSCNTMIF